MKKAQTFILKQHDNMVNINRYLSGYDQTMQIYSGDYTAKWLLSGVHSDVWIIRTKETITLKDGSFKYVKKFHWNIPLADNTLLTDGCNQVFRELFQKLFLLMQESQIVTTNSRNMSTLLTDLFFIRNFIRWIYLNKSILNPSLNGMSKITQSQLESFVEVWCHSGDFGLFQIGEKIIETYNMFSEVQIRSHDIFMLSDDDRSNFINFLVDNNVYEMSQYGYAHLNKYKFAKLFGVECSDLLSDKGRLFLRQFEPDKDKVNRYVLMPSSRNTEYPSHKVPLLCDVYEQKNSYIHIDKFVSILGNLLKFRPLFPCLIPDAQQINLQKLMLISRDHGRPNEVTPWVPLHIIFKLMKGAVDLVLNYGDDIISYFEEIHSDRSKGQQCTIQYFQKRFIEVAPPVSLKGFNITKISNICNQGIPSSEQFNNLRSSPTLHSLIEVLLGSCIFLIAALKPIRMSELRALPYNCLYFKDNDGFWLRQKLSKSGIEEFLTETDRPIPKITAKAVQLLQKWHDVTCDIVDSCDKNESKKLLLMPNMSNFKKASIISNKKIDLLIDRLTDYVNIPPDKYGRRWYVNVHELRKSFILTFFWTYKFSSLDSCRWIAGHKEPEHVFNYIQANIPGEEMVEAEAEYAHQQLRLFAIDRTLTEMENTEELNSSVCEHFGVNSISEIPEQDLCDWIALAIEKGIYSIEVFGINNTDKSIDANIAIKIREFSDESL